MAKKRLKDEDIEARIVSIDQASPYVRLLAYGPNGGGKTRIAASLPDVLLIDVNEEGTKSAREFAIEPYNGKVFHVNAWEDIVHIYWYLKKGRGRKKYRSVAIDTLTALQNLCMVQVLDEAEDRDPNRPPSTPAQRNWGTMGQMMEEQILNFRNLPMNIVFTAQRRVLGDEEEGEELIHVPNLSPKPRGVAMGAVDIIGFAYQAPVKKAAKKGKEKKEWEHRLLVGPHEQYETKDRSNSLGRVVRRPNMLEIIELAGPNLPEEEEE